MVVVPGSVEWLLCWVVTVFFAQSSDVPKAHRVRDAADQFNGHTMAGFCQMATSDLAPKVARKGQGDGLGNFLTTHQILRKSRAYWCFTSRRSADAVSGRNPELWQAGLASDTGS